jgi:hypothetical protein
MAFSIRILIPPHQLHISGALRANARNVIIAYLFYCSSHDSAIATNALPRIFGNLICVTP